MTAAALIALRDAGSLDPQCHYIVTDWVQGTTLTGPNTVELHAVSASVLSLEAKVFTPYDNEGWDGLYDIDRGAVGQMIELRDNLNNTVRDTTGTSAIVGTFPWGAATWSENYFDSVTLTNPATARTVVRTTVRDSTLDMTGWTSGTVSQSEILGSTVLTTGATFTMTNSRLVNSTITGEATGSITLTAGTTAAQLTLVQDAGSLRTWSFTDSDIRNVTMRGQGGAAARSVNISHSRLRNRPNTGDALIALGDSTVAFVGADVSFFSTWALDGATGSSVNILNCTIDAGIVTRGPSAGDLFITQGQHTGMFLDHQGSGDMTLTQARIAGGTIRLATGSTGGVTLFGAVVEGGTVQVNDVRSLSLNFGSYVGQAAQVIESGTTPTATPAIGDRVDQSRIEAGGQVQFATTTGANGNFVTRSRVGGTSVAGQGIVRIDGTTDGAWMDACHINGGIVTITNASSGLNGGTAFHDNHVDAGSTVTYTGGDSTDKQVRNNHITGQSTMTLTSLTGSAGAGAGDVFGMSVRGQSTVTVTGARVVGQPVRDCTVEQGSTLNIPASGSTQRCRVAGGATVNAGAFDHFDTEVSLATTVTLTAPNSNRLANKSFSDVI